MLKVIKVINTLKKPPKVISAITTSINLALLQVNMDQRLQNASIKRRFEQAGYRHRSFESGILGCFVAVYGAALGFITVPARPPHCGLATALRSPRAASKTYNFIEVISLLRCKYPKRP